MTELVAPRDLAQWSLHCFCLRARANPKRVVDLDDNGRILFEAIGGTTLADLRASGVGVTESQIRLMEVFDLLSNDEGRINTRIPVMGPEVVGDVRGRAKAIAAEVMDGVSDAAREIVRALDERGLTESAHAVVFGQSLDGVLWDVLRGRGDVPDVEPTVDQPFWRGAFWAAYPGREGSAGTNEVAGSHASLVMVWDEGSAEALRELEIDPATSELLDGIDSSQVAVTLRDGERAPVVRANDPLHLAGVALAEAVASRVPTGSGCRDLLDDAGVAATDREAVVIVVHELIWEITGLLSRSDLLTAPPTGGVVGRIFFRVDG